MKLPHALLITACAAALAAGVALFAYVAVQQGYRQSANDPQLSMVQNAWVGLSRGQKPQDITGTGKVDLPTSLDPFAVVYDSSHHVISTNANFGNDNFKFDLTPPAGSFAAADSKLNVFTWEPTKGNRYAAVLLHVQK